MEEEHYPHELTHTEVDEALSDAAPVTEQTPPHALNRNLSTGERASTVARRSTVAPAVPPKPSVSVFSGARRQSADEAYLAESSTEDFTSERSPVDTSMITRASLAPTSESTNSEIEIPLKTHTRNPSFRMSRSPSFSSQSLLSKVPSTRKAAVIQQVTYSSSAVSEDIEPEAAVPAVRPIIEIASKESKAADSQSRANVPLSPLLRPHSSESSILDDRSSRFTNAVRPTESPLLDGQSSRFANVGRPGPRVHAEARGTPQGTDADETKDPFSVRTGRYRAAHRPSGDGSPVERYQPASPLRERSPSRNNEEMSIFPVRSGRYRTGSADDEPSGAVSRETSTHFVQRKPEEGRGTGLDAYLAIGNEIDQEAAEEAKLNTSDSDVYIARVDNLDTSYWSPTPAQLAKLCERTDIIIVRLPLGRPMPKDLLPVKLYDDGAYLIKGASEPVPPSDPTQTQNDLEDGAQKVNEEGEQSRESRELEIEIARHKRRREFEEHQNIVQKMKVCVDADDPKAIIRFLARNWVFGYPSTDGSVSENYIAFVKNTHPFFAIFFAHPLNYLSTKDRIIVFFCSLGFCFFVSVVLLADNQTKADTCSAHCDRHVIDIYGTERCFGGTNDGITVAAYNSSCNYTNPYLIALLAAAIVTPYGLFVKFVAACGCLQGRNWTEQGLGEKFKKFVETIGDHVLLLFIVLSSGFAVLGLVINNNRGNHLSTVWTWAFSKIASQLYWFVLTGPLFAYKYPIDKKAFYERQYEAMEESGTTNEQKDDEDPHLQALIERFHKKRAHDLAQTGRAISMRLSRGREGASIELQPLDLVEWHESRSDKGNNHAVGSSDQSLVQTLEQANRYS